MDKSWCSEWAFKRRNYMLMCGIQRLKALSPVSRIAWICSHCSFGGMIITALRWNERELVRIMRSAPGVDLAVLWVIHGARQSRAQATLLSACEARVILVI